jgi:DNA repair exonuclease SbcCD ATPase subunit
VCYRAAEHLRDAERAQVVLQTAAADVQNAVHEQIATVVSKCLKAVFDDPYEFRIIFERSRGKTSARLVFVRNGQEYDPRFSVGGGVLDVASFALWVACLLAKRPRPRLFLCADEPFRHLSRRYSARMAKCLETLASEFVIQFVIVTHNSEFEVGKVVRIG